MKSSAKAKSFHVAVRGSPPQHVTLPSRILIRPPADERWATGLHRKNHRHHQWNHLLNRLTINGHLLVIQTLSHRPSPNERYVERVVATEPSDRSSVPSPRNHERSVERVLAMEPQTIQHPSHSGKVGKPSGRCQACVERTAAVILASPQHAAGPAPRIDGTYASGQTVTM